MSIACLVEDDAAFAEVRDLVREAGWDCVRGAIDAVLSSYMRDDRWHLLLVDSGGRLATEARILAWLEGRPPDDAPVVLTAKHPDAKRVARALDAGAADFIARPADPAECRARLRAVLRRAEPAARRSSTVGAAGFQLEYSRGRLCDGEDAVDLTELEFSMAWLFFSNPGVCLSREAISVAVWGASADVTCRTLQQHVHSLRKKLGLGLGRGVSLVASYGEGYRLEIARAAAAAAGGDRAWTR
jgi:DNA-binding response OmpR family regulator